jgi:hypothetical protein
MGFPWSRLLAAVPAIVAGAAAQGECGLYLNQEQALRVAFPEGTDVERKSVFLDAGMVEAIEKLAKAKVESGVVTFYMGKQDGQPTGYAFFSNHMVRTMPETIMTVVNPDGTVQMVELLAFYEPDDYRPPKRWLSLFSRQKLDNDLRVKRGIRNLTGATLTAQAVTDSVRRTLATFETIIRGKEN